MPELLEIDRYREAALATVGHRIEAVTLVDPLMVVGVSAVVLADALVGRRVSAVRRHGKLLMFDLDDGHVLGLHFGMTGRLAVGDHQPIEELEYGARSDDSKWNRFIVQIGDVGAMRLNDPRRFGRIVVDPDEASLGPEASVVTTAQLVVVLGRSQAPLKARLLDQRRIAGLGNLLVDETLWRARLAPGRSSTDLGRDEVRTLARSVRSTVALLGRRGGSHTGDLQAHRQPGSLCPRCGQPLRRDQVGGRTTYWCPNEQR